MARAVHGTARSCPPARGLLSPRVYGTYDPVFVSPVYVYGAAGTCFVLGLVFLNRYNRDILNER